MLTQSKGLRSFAVVTMIVASGGMLGGVAAQKASVPKTQDKLALGQEDIKRVLLIMEPNKNGKISKEEYMKFMEAEFERLDKDKTGELDVKKLTQSNVTASRFVGK
jgi:hypothetical protein